jgi:hypothetical protein
LEPKEVSRITEAYEQALHTLCVKDRDDPLTETIAKTKRTKRTKRTTPTSHRSCASRTKIRA